MTWDDIAENMTMPRFNAIGRYWKKHPPLHVLAAGLAGYRAPPDPTAPANQLAESLEQLPEFEE